MAAANMQDASEILAADAGDAAPTSVAMSVDVEWGLQQQPAGSASEEFKSRILGAMKGICKSFGGLRCRLYLGFLLLDFQ
jgi:hypothetical protein